MIIDHPTTEDLPGLRMLWRQAFGDSEAFLDLFFVAAFAPERCLRIREDGAVAAALYWFDCNHGGKKVAYVYAVATAESRRGRGLCRALMGNLHEILFRRGYAGAVLVPGEPELFRFYEKLGYEPCAAVRELACTAGDRPAELRALDADTYAILRRNLLPPNGLIQERENLEFLAALGNFYAGDNLVVWAFQTPEGWITGELLGDAAQAPGVVKALGGQAGVFRMPGKDKPFAMYRSFDGLPGPGYFGFAYD